MKKLRLELDALAVESFTTHAAAGAGTVAGAAFDQVIGGQRTYPNCSEIDACPSALGCTYNGTCYDPSCAQADTCARTCAASCAFTCAATCPMSCYEPNCSGPICSV